MAVLRISAEFDRLLNCVLRFTAFPSRFERNATQNREVYEKMEYGLKAKIGAPEVHGLR